MSSWTNFKRSYLPLSDLGIALDISKMEMEEAFFHEMEPHLQKALLAMEALEKGAITNVDEGRQVGHYWLRNTDLAPTDEVKQAIDNTLESLRAFVHSIHSGQQTCPGGIFKHLIVIGIGGSILGPQFVSDALGDLQHPKLLVHFIDNTDPEGIQRVLLPLEGVLPQTLTVVISKSGGTLETRNAMLEVEAAYQSKGLDFGRCAVAITQKGSKLDAYADKNNWLARFPMWDWVGGRTSELSVTGLLPAALEGIDIEGLIRGAAQMDVITRSKLTASNPAALLALAWFHATGGKGKKDMVILPYRDRLSLLSRYLQQLVMESLGKERDQAGNIVHQGITVYGNKGSTDQHAYVQQLRDGVANFFVTFIEVLASRSKSALELEPGYQSDDYLNCFFLGTRAALHEKVRPSITLTLEAISPESIGALIALYERTVGLYASLIGINAYHQPGVEAGKKAASEFLELLGRIRTTLAKSPGQQFTPITMAKTLGLEDESIEIVYRLLCYCAANDAKTIKEQTGSSLDTIIFCSVP